MFLETTDNIHFIEIQKKNIVLKNGWFSLITEIIYSNIPSLLGCNLLNRNQEYNIIQRPLRK